MWEVELTLITKKAWNVAVQFLGGHYPKRIKAYLDLLHVTKHDVSYSWFCLSSWWFTCIPGMSKKQMKPFALFPLWQKQNYKGKWTEIRHFGNGQGNWAKFFIAKTSGNVTRQRNKNWPIAGRRIPEIMPESSHLRWWYLNGSRVR